MNAKKPNTTKKATGAKKSASKKAAPAKKAVAKKATSQSAEIISSATLSGIRISAQKARLVINLVRGKAVEDALNALRFMPKKGAKLAAKLIESAMHNAREQKGADIDRLYIAKAFVNEGPTLKRIIPRAQGRATSIFKRSSHITVQLAQK
jgi:large subunit ribosomal protein L22